MATPVPQAAQQSLALVVGLKARIEQVEIELNMVRKEFGRQLLLANRAGCTYETIVEQTGIKYATVSNSIAAARESLGVSKLPTGRRTGISPKTHNRDGRGSESRAS